MKLDSLLRVIVASALMALIHDATAVPLVFDSPGEQITVIELYTSHGCNSCPPADAWLRRLVDHPDLWQKLVPLSFHVDYWDYLGWSDRFARPAFSQRQRDYRRSGGVHTVYTPAMLLNGKEWRGWLQDTSPALSTGENIGSLRLEFELEPEKPALLVFHPKQVLRGLDAHLAIVGFGLATPIGGGENAGKTLREDFVVLGMSNGIAAAGEALRWQLPWPKLKGLKTTRLAVVAWVNAKGNPRPLQSVAGWLP